MNLIHCLAFSSCLLALATPIRAANAIPPEQRQFFEQKIRPVLVEYCYECHSTQAKKLKSGLLLDSQGGWQKGGDAGKPAVLPGDTEKVSCSAPCDMTIPISPCRQRSPNSPTRSSPI